MKINKLTIDVFELASGFAENKDIAKNIRDLIILPNLQEGINVVVNFKGVEGATQSFIHALISEPIRKYPDNFLDNVEFKNCNQVVKNIILTVVEYSLIRPEQL